MSTKPSKQLKNKIPKTLSKYTLTKTLGTGLFKVKLAVDQTDKKTYAAKVCKSYSRQDLLQQEAEIIKQINNLNIPNIVKMIEFFENNGKTPTKPMIDETQQSLKPYKCHSAMILELAANETIFDYVLGAGPFDDKLARTYFKKLITAISQLHKNGYVHRDLKLENLLLNDNFDLLIADFGFAATFTESIGDRMKTRLGTENYMPPEMYSIGGDYSGTKADIFSCGVALFIMMLGRPPFFKAKSNDPFYKHQLNGTPSKFWNIYETKINNNQEYDKSWKEIIDAMIHPQEDKRPSAEELLEFEWMKGDVLSDEELKEQMVVKRKLVEENH
eukprot:CAMPEP_0114592136 /NCGR_PEP_ID=MMETSP0125-20121206/14043_1 /TAXON_ID=485358 ORGANISM="Aristerostoma sp., Strain ATCC 50986" /NCGR_SAMPLE_ID=MMETSP0125 /ASSEMBLY_ACC=CAM_ASM_000245 /LENGTH=329 /DNA_ID=CAMNT_0001790639 /DNA_START=95 /DNA_END=1084 /DNA_ORIENTATION=-